MRSDIHTAVVQRVISVKECTAVIKRSPHEQISVEDGDIILAVNCERFGQFDGGTDSGDVLYVQKVGDEYRVNDYPDFAFYVVADKLTGGAA